jgi:hypothetical protein
MITSASSSSRTSTDALDKPLDMLGDHACLALTQHLEQVAIGHYARSSRLVVRAEEHVENPARVGRPATAAPGWARLWQ